MEMPLEQKTRKIQPKPKPKTESEKTVDEKSQEQLAVQMASATTPLCPTLNINTAYTLPDTETGGSYCYHFEVTQRAKAQVFLVGQSTNTDFALTLLRHEADDSLTVLGVSDTAGNADESVLALTSQAITTG